METEDHRLKTEGERELQFRSFDFAQDFRFAPVCDCRFCLMALKKYDNLKDFA